MSTLSVVTIDGPAGAGKSTVAREVANSLGFRFLDTGAMYRAVALAALRAGMDCSDASQIGTMARSLSIEISSDGEIFLNGTDVSGEIRTQEVTDAASTCSAFQEVREIISRLQRENGEMGRLVCEGRDMGTVVFPDAAVRIYLDATTDIRARRRKLELEESGELVDLESLKESISARDRADSEREIAPLKRIPEHNYIDTSEMTRDEVIDKVLQVSLSGLGPGEEGEA